MWNPDRSILDTQVGIMENRSQIHAIGHILCTWRILNFLSLDSFYPCVAVQGCANHYRATRPTCWRAAAGDVDRSAEWTTHEPSGLHPPCGWRWDGVKSVDILWECRKRHGERLARGGEGEGLWRLCRQTNKAAHEITQYKRQWGTRKCRKYHIDLWILQGVVQSK